jgi:predicted metal-dependent peptidase
MMSDEQKTMTAEEFQKRFDRVLTRLGIKFPFFCQVLASRKIFVDETIPTLATDGPNIYCNTTFWANHLDNETEISGVAHELVHVVLEHMWRRGSRDPRLWNIACDYKVNQYLENEGFTIGAGWLRDRQYDNMSEEQIYTAIEKQADEHKKNNPNQEGDGQGKPDFDDLKDPQGSADEQAKDREDLRSAVIRAFNTYKAQGHGGGLAEYLADKVTKVKEPWHEHLRRFMTKMTLTESDWRRVNRRELLRSGVIAAEVGRPTIELVTVIIDTSGSIGQRTLDYFGGHINNILDDVKPKLVRVIYCDAAVNKVEEYTTDMFPVELTMCGGGGTDFRPAFDKIDELGDEPDVAIYLTDTYGTYPDVEPNYPVFWASIYDYERCSKPPFGEFLFIDEAD